MKRLAIIGGTGLAELKGLEITGREASNTAYGEPSGHLVFGRYGQQDIVFLPRHGHKHTIPPHKINYRANIKALHNVDVDRIIAVNAVGGIRSDCGPGRVVIPNQLVDYTFGREHTFYDGRKAMGLEHIDFTKPYSEGLRQILIGVAEQANIDVVRDGVYAATQGPRLETAAEINRYEQDGCTIVGMTGMPEAALAKEAGIDYASCSVVVNWAAGRGQDDIHMDIERYLSEGMDQVKKLLTQLLS